MSYEALSSDERMQGQPSLVLLVRRYRNTGAIFWGDIEGHFDANKLRNMFEQQKVDPKLFPLDSWRTRMGFDSGVLVINKAKCSAVMNRLQEMTRSFQQQWAQYTHGDKDLWHIAWMLHNQNFTYVPYVGALGAFCESDHKFCMTAQVIQDLSRRDDRMFTITIPSHRPNLTWRGGLLSRTSFGGMGDFPNLISMVTSGLHSRLSLADKCGTTHPTSRYGMTSVRRCSFGTLGSGRNILKN